MIFISSNVFSRFGIPNDILEDKMECLDINEGEQNSSPSCSKESFPQDEEVPTKRVLRRRSLPISSMPTENRRVLTKPKKKDSTANKLESIYLCKQVKRLPPNLETIFEEPKLTKSNKVLYLGLRKQKRVISFNDSSNKGKVKKRQMKAKKVLGKSFNVKKRGSMEALLEKLKYVDN